jgi:hypothetical protein
LQTSFALFGPWAISEIVHGYFRFCVDPYYSTDERGILVPYTTIPTLVDTQVLSAAHLNLLSANQAFLYGVGNAANFPFPSYSGVQVTLEQSEARWDIRHRVPYLHWKIISMGGAWNYARVYYNGVKVGKSGASTNFTGTYNLSTWAGLPNLIGAWVTGFAYDDDVDGNGASGNSDDGHVVTEGGQYYRCKLSHTSSSTNRPGSGASWATYWDLLTLPGVGTMCAVWVDVNFNSGTEVRVEYIVETDSASF